MYKLIKYEEKYRKKLSQFIEKVFVDEFDFEEHREYISNLKFEYAKNSNESCWIVIDDNSNIIGTISCINKNEQECYLKYFYVDRQYRGKGVSKQLYKAFCDFIEEKKYKKIYLGTYEKLERAVKFYEKNGFIEYKNEMAKPGEKYFYKEC